MHGYLELVFELAADALANYEAVKRERGSVDFVDQETLVLNALRDSEAVRQALAEELDLVLVDEFQDTSPLQLALFVELAKLAKRSVWVGDSKQAIYGFRGTDSALISTVLAAVQSWGGKLGEPLTTSRRSIPPLVELVNAVFVPAFSGSMPPTAVQLSACRDSIEGQAALVNWKFEGKGGEVFDSLGLAIAELLEKEVRVQDRDTGELRPARPEDVAVLCRFNNQIPLVANSLSRWNVPSVSSRPGLLGTPEAALVVACLRRMADRTDTLASATIVSLAGGQGPDAWISDRLAHLEQGLPPESWGMDGANAHPLLARLETLRPRLAALTPAEALLLASAESGVFRLAAAWSKEPEEAHIRHANVEALLGMARAYEDECRSGKRPGTLSGLLQWLERKRAAGLDNRAPASGGAVEVLTHHAAKGLEWPIVVLTGLDSEARSPLWGVRARTDGTFDAQDPLANRFVHYWPRPYGKRKPPAAAQAAEASPLGAQMQAQGLEEHKRLLYVSMTRARDVLVLATHGGKSPTTWLDEVGGTPLLVGASGEVALPDSSTPLMREARIWTEQDMACELPQRKHRKCHWFAPAPVVEERGPLWMRPSDEEGGQHQSLEVVSVGKRVPLQPDVDMAALGTAFHHCIALSFADPASELQLPEISRMASAWGVGAAVEAQAIARQVQAFKEWLTARWPRAQAFAEVPLEVRLDDGRVVRGQIDLLLEIADGWVLLDHKAHPGSAVGDPLLAQRHGAQLGRYAQVLKHHTGRPVLEQWLFLPVAAQLVRLA